MVSKFIFAIAIAAAAAVAPLHAQDDAAARSNPYKLCIAEIQNAPLEAYRPCKQYLEQASPDDTKHRERVSAWIVRYEKVLPYVQFLQGLTADANARWFVNGPDMEIQIGSVVDGVLKTIHVKPGEAVTTGQLLFELT
jgi:multidrug efflux pump subunit AcrA (membrane-fusion protein)